MTKVMREIDQALETGPNSNAGVTVPLYNLEESLASTDFSLREYSIEDLNQIEVLFKELGNLFEYSPQEMIPLPTTIPVTDSELLTPFPFVVEAPTLDVELNFAETLNKLLENTSVVNDNIHKVG